MALLLALIVYLIGFYIYPHALHLNVKNPEPVQTADNRNPDQTDENSQIDQEVLAQIRTIEPGETADPGTLDPDSLRTLFYSQPVSEELLQRLQPNLFDPGQDFIAAEDLRDIRILYHDFDGQIRVGQLVANQLIAQDLEEIFYSLYQQNYPIENVTLPFDAQNDEQSMDADTTRSLAFTWQDGVPMKHEHSLGLAVDFNPLYNPQVVTEDGQIYIMPASGAPWADRSLQQAHMIDENDAAYKAFTEHGFFWGGTWDGRNDYQHFEKYFNYDTGDIDPSMVNSAS